AFQGGDRYELLWRRLCHSCRRTNYAKAKKLLHPANIVGWRTGHAARQHAVSRRQVGCWRIYRVACQGSGTFRREGVCPRTWRNANQLGEPGESKHPAVASGLRTVRRRGGFRTEIVLGTRGERPRESGSSNPSPGVE